VLRHAGAVEGTLTGRLLVATPLIGDGTFDRSVVRVLGHDEDGAVGVILNRPTATPVTDVLDEWGGRVAAPGVVFVGGPVDGQTVIGLAEEGAIDLHLSPDDLFDPPGEIRLYAGQAGWGPGQLEEEIVQRAWWVADAEPGDTLTRDPDRLWEQVLRRQPTPTRWFANFPEDLRTG
jgi:putative transcriptional regulator